jgi:hypothetical protein
MWHLHYAKGVNQTLLLLSLGNLYNSDDPKLQNFYNKRRNEYNQLRNSDDPELKNYWWAARARQNESYLKNIHGRIQKETVEGMTLNLSVSGLSGNRRSFFLGSAKFYLSEKIVVLDGSKPVYCQCYITETPAPHEDRFAKDIRLILYMIFLSEEARRIHGRC